MSQEEQQKRNDDAWTEICAAISAPEVELLELLINDDSGDLNEAVEYLFGTAVHQGTLYDITLPVLRFCVRMLDQFSPEATEWVVVWIQLVGSIIRDFPEDPYAIQLHKENASVVEALLALDAKKGGEYYTRALGAWAWYFDAEDELVEGVQAAIDRRPVRPVVLQELEAAPDLRGEPAGAGDASMGTSVSGEPVTSAVSENAPAETGEQVPAAQSAERQAGSADAV